MILIIIIGIIIGIINRNGNNNVRKKDSVRKIDTIKKIVLPKDLKLDVTFSNASYISQVNFDKNEGVKYEIKWFYADNEKGENAVEIKDTKYLDNTSYSLKLYPITFRTKFIGCQINCIANDKNKIFNSTFSKFPEQQQLKTGDKFRRLSEIITYTIKIVDGNRILIPAVEYVPVNMPETGYEISQEKIKEWKQYLNNVEVHQKLWDKVIKIAPPEHIDLISEFTLHNSYTHPNSDRKNIWGYTSNILVDGFVTGLHKWRLGLSLDKAMFAMERNLFNTEQAIIHEVSHLITLNNKEISPKFNIRGNDCEGGIIEGCPRDNSVLLGFYRKFWKDKQLEDGQGYLNNQKYPDAFVTPYAASDITEDLAETIRECATTKEDYSDQNNMTKEKYQKMRYLYNISTIKTAIDYMKTQYLDISK